MCTRFCTLYLALHAYLNIKLILALYQVLSKYPPVRANHSYNLLDPAIYCYSFYTMTLKLVLPLSPLFGSLGEYWIIIFTIYMYYINFHYGRSKCPHGCWGLFWEKRAKREKERSDKGVRETGGTATVVRLEMHKH